MADTAEYEPRTELPLLPLSERVLTEVDHLNAYRNSDGSYPDFILEGVLTNLETAIQEGAMPHAVTETRHEVINRPELDRKAIMWMGKTAIQAAMSGYKWHIHRSALDRVDIEIDEARYATENMRIGHAFVFISPRMSTKDAAFEVARQEHLADDDSVRVSWFETDANGIITTRVMQSLLVRDIPLNAWTAMLQSPDNIFGKPIQLNDTESALSVMRVHRQLELSVEKLPDGPVSLIEAVLPYIESLELRASVAKQIKMFKGDQQIMRQVAEQKAAEWLEFEVSLAESLYNGFADLNVRRFIFSLQDHWDKEEIQIIKKHLINDTEVRVTRELVAVLESQKRRLLLGSAASLVPTSDITSGVDQGVLNTIRDNEQLIQIARQDSKNYYELEIQNMRLIASLKMKVGGGCTVVNNQKEVDLLDSFSIQDSFDEKSNDNDSPENWKWKKGVCRVKTCAKKTEVGPCDICRNCQAKFDRGEDPTVGAKYETKKVEMRDKKEIVSILIWSGMDGELHRVIDEEPKRKKEESSSKRGLVVT